MSGSRTYELINRLLITILILAVYMTGRIVPLYGIDQTAYRAETLSAQTLMDSMISGTRYGVFALGIMPYISSNLIIWIFTALRGAKFRARLSIRRQERITTALMLGIAFASAWSRSSDLIFVPSYLSAQTLRGIAVLEMVMGATVIYWFAGWNKERGIGGTTPIILVNIVTQLIATGREFTWGQLRIPVVLSLAVAAVIFLMEQVIIHIPVQRVSINNQYADKNYIPFKLSPIGIMPVMFALSFFMIFRELARALLWIAGKNSMLHTFYERMNLNDPVGATVYLAGIFTLNIVFSFVMIAPGELADQLQRAGDSIVNVYAGKKTRRYLRGRLFLLAIFSGIVMCLMMGISLHLALKGEIAPELALLPATVMILTGLLCPLYLEIKSYWKFYSYSFFL